MDKWNDKLDGNDDSVGSNRVEVNAKATQNCEVPPNNTTKVKQGETHAACFDAAAEC
jgi:hypothetical protein